MSELIIDKIKMMLLNSIELKCKQECRKNKDVLIVRPEFKKLYEESFNDRRNNKRTK